MVPLINTRKTGQGASDRRMEIKILKKKILADASYLKTSEWRQQLVIDSNIKIVITIFYICTTPQLK